MRFDAIGDGLVVGDPPAFGTGMTYRSLQNIAFLHQRPGFRMSEPPLYAAILKTVDQGVPSGIE